MATPRPRRGYSAEKGLRRRRGRGHGIPWCDESRRRRGRDVAIQRRRVAATPRPRRGYSAEKGRGPTAAATWIFSGEGSRRTRRPRRGLPDTNAQARALAFRLRPRSVLEFGCGLGTTSDFLARFTPGGSRVICIEPEPMLAEIFAKNAPPRRPMQLAFNAFAPENEACMRDLTAQPRFDLVLSLEVAEHLESHQLPPLIDALCGATRKYLVFTAARPPSPREPRGQAGTGHVRSPRGRVSESRRRRGRDVDSPRRRVAAAPRPRRGSSVETGARLGTRIDEEQNVVAPGIREARLDLSAEPHASPREGRGPRAALRPGTQHGGHGPRAAGRGPRRRIAAGAETEAQVAATT